MTEKTVNLFMKNQMNGCNVLTKGWKKRDHDKDDGFIFDHFILLIIWLCLNNVTTISLIVYYCLFCLQVISLVKTAKIIFVQSRTESVQTSTFFVFFTCSGLTFSSNLLCAIALILPLNRLCGNSKTLPSNGAQQLLTKRSAVFISNQENKKTPQTEVWNFSHFLLSSSKIITNIFVFFLQTVCK